LQKRHCCAFSHQIPGPHRQLCGEIALADSGSIGGAHQEADSYFGIRPIGQALLAEKLLRLSITYFVWIMVCAL
jgi:hypothetical protein